MGGINHPERVGLLSIYYIPYIYIFVYVYIYICIYIYMYWVANMIFSILIVHVRDCPLPDPAATGARYVDPGEVERTGLLPEAPDKEWPASAWRSARRKKRVNKLRKASRNLPDDQFRSFSGMKIGKKMRKNVASNIFQASMFEDSKHIPSIFWGFSLEVGIEITGVRIRHRFSGRQPLTAPCARWHLKCIWNLEINEMNLT